VGYYGYGHGSLLALIPFAAFIVLRMLAMRRRQAPGGQVPGRAPMAFRDQHHDPEAQRHGVGYAPGHAPSSAGQAADSSPSAASSSGIGASGLAAGWFPDPTGRFDQRYWSGSTWTEHVTRGGAPATDEPPSSLRGDSSGDPAS
jgi:hypothetical protein